MSIEAPKTGSTTGATDKARDSKAEQGVSDRVKSSLHKADQHSHTQNKSHAEQSAMKSFMESSDALEASKIASSDPIKSSASSDVNVSVKYAAGGQKIFVLGTGDK